MILTVIMVMAQNGWKPSSMDIKTAFLQGHALERYIFVRRPKETDYPDNDHFRSLE